LAALSSVLDVLATGLAKVYMKTYILS
jgi:hypothetical protein